MAMMLPGNGQQIMADTLALLVQSSSKEKEKSGVTQVAAPLLPAGYEPIGSPQPLSGDREGYWLMYAHNMAYDISGILIYDETTVACFLTSQEAMYTLFTLLDNLIDLTLDCPVEFSDDHNEDIIPLWNTWSRLNYQHIRPASPTATLCVWCWYEMHPSTPFPAAASSSCCAPHEQFVKESQKVSA